MKCSKCDKDVPFGEWFINNYQHKKCLQEEKKENEKHNELKELEKKYEDKEFMNKLDEKFLNKDTKDLEFVQCIEIWFEFSGSPSIKNEIKKISDNINSILYNVLQMKDEKGNVLGYGNPELNKNITFWSGSEKLENKKIYTNYLSRTFLTTHIKNKDNSYTFKVIPVAFRNDDKKKKHNYVDNYWSMYMFSKEKDLLFEAQKDIENIGISFNKEDYVNENGVLHFFYFEELENKKYPYITMDYGLLKIKYPLIQRVRLFFKNPELEKEIFGENLLEFRKSLRKQHQNYKDKAGNNLDIKLMDKWISELDKLIEVEKKN